MTDYFLGNLPSLTPFCGPGYIAGESPDGLVTVNTAPGVRQIEVRHRKTRVPIMTKFSEPDGTYRFDGLDPGEEFDVIGRDWTGTYNDVIVARVFPYAGPDLSVLVVPVIRPGAVVSWQLVARYGELPLTWSITGLPAWLSVTTGGLVTGTAPGTESTTPITITCTDAHGEVSTVAVAVAVALSAWWRVLVLTSNSSPNYGSMQELEFRATVGGANLCIGGTALSSSYFASPAYLPTYAFDGNTTAAGPTPPECWAGDGVEATPWLGYHMTAGSAVNQIMVCARHAWPAQSPKDFKVQSSLDGATWIDEWAVSGQTGWTAGEIRVFTRP